MTSSSLDNPCLIRSTEVRLHQPQAEDILCDEHLLDLFRIVRQVLHKKKRDPAKLAKLFFCLSYALGDKVKFHKPVHETQIYFEDKCNIGVHAVQLPRSSTCCCVDPGVLASDNNNHKWPDSASLSSSSSSYSFSSSSPLPRMFPLTSSQQQQQQSAVADPYTVRPYTNICLLHPDVNNTDASTARPATESYARADALPPSNEKEGEFVMEPKQRGFYYQDGHITREPALLQRYAEQGILTHASIVRKRKHHQTVDVPLQTPVKKPKIPHRHGEFEQRRDDILGRLRNISMADLEQKAQRLPSDYSLAIERAELPPPGTIPNALSAEEAAELLQPSLRILTSHSNMKPHLETGMNQNGIYYNTDYFRLYLAFEQFQKTFAALFPNEVVHIPEWTGEGGTGGEQQQQDRDRDRNANMKAYRVWIEPLLTESNWAAFRRNIVVGERIMQLTKVVGQGILLMTKELSGSKLHLTFTNSEWDEFINGLCSGRWDHATNNNGAGQGTATTRSALVAELRLKLATQYWFRPDGHIVPPEERRAILAAENNTSLM